jgi:hypothetical protein
MYPESKKKPYSDWRLFTSADGSKPNAFVNASGGLGVWPKLIIARTRITDKATKDAPPTILRRVSRWILPAISSKREPSHPTSQIIPTQHMSAKNRPATLQPRNR